MIMFLFLISSIASFDVRMSHFDGWVMLQLRNAMSSSNAVIIKREVPPLAGGTAYCIYMVRAFLYSYYVSVEFHFGAPAPGRQIRSSPAPFDGLTTRNHI